MVGEDLGTFMMVLRRAKELDGDAQVKVRSLRVPGYIGRPLAGRWEAAAR